MTEELPPTHDTIDWTPAVKRSPVIRTHALQSPEAGRLVFQPLWRARLVFAAFPALGVAIFLLSAFGLVVRGIGDAWVGIVAGAGFFAAGLFLRRGFQPRGVFDRKRGLFWQGRGEPRGAAGDRAPSGDVALGDIRAVQVLQRTQRSGSQNYDRVQELNLVLSDGSRRNVVSFRGQSRIVGMATRLGEFLDVPLWQAEELTER